ncbi:MAG: hypothetical protein NXH73_07425 [Flavobacteriaceae bacterium]|nr:hypothetical protein [Flavobacteriaceae bacterium]
MIVIVSITLAILTFLLLRLINLSDNTAIVGGVTGGVVGAIIGSKLKPS